MDATTKLAEHAEAWSAATETAGWAFAHGLRSAGEATGSAEALALADVVDAALATDGAWGLVDLAIAGSMCGGIGHNDVEALVRAVDERIARETLAAA